MDTGSGHAEIFGDAVIAAEGAEATAEGWAAELTQASCDAGFDLPRRRQGPLAALYRREIRRELAGAAGLAGCLLEPVLHGAGGMLLVDPLYQHVLGTEVQARGLPLVLDEVFAGLWRLGVASAGRDLLGLTPDIACYSKLVRGEPPRVCGNVSGARI